MKNENNQYFIHYKDVDGIKHIFIRHAPSKEEARRMLMRDEPTAVFIKTYTRRAQPKWVWGLDGWTALKRHKEE